MTATPSAPSTTFKAVLEGEGNKVGFVVPADAVAELGAGQRPPVAVDLDGYVYRSTVAVMGGRHLIGVSTAIRQETGLAAGSQVQVTLTLDTSPRPVDVPDDFARALEASPGVKAFFDGLSNSVQRYHVTNINGTKNPETRQRRIDKAIGLFLDGKPR
jgi:hypothetical protein